MSIRNDKLVQVCAACLRASCWYGEFMCDDARTADLVTKTVGDLKKLNREHSDYWSAQMFRDIYGTSTPSFPPPDVPATPEPPATEAQA